MNRKALLILLLALALAVTACGGGAEDSDTTSAPTTSAPDTTPGSSTPTTQPGSTSTSQPAAEPLVIEPGLTGLQVVDDLTFTVEFATPDPEFPLKLAYAAYFPLPSVAYADPAAFEESPIGNGPFMMDGPWEHDVVVPLRRFDGYTGPDPAQIEQLQWVIIDNLDTAYNEILSGNLDVLGPSLPTSQIALAAEEFGDHYGQSPSTSFTYMGFPLYVPEYQNPDVRRALSMAIDRDLIVEQIYSNTRVAAFSTIPPIFQGAREHVCDYWDYNPDEARALWDSVEHPASIVVSFNTGGAHEEWVEAVANMWRSTLGIEDISFESMEFSEYNPMLDSQGAPGPFRLGWGQDYPSPLNFLEPLYASYNTPPIGSNNTFFENAEFDALIAQGKEAVAGTGLLADGIPFYQQAEDILCNEVPVAPVWFRTNQYVFGEGIANVYYDSYSDLGVTKVTSDDGLVTAQLSEPEHLFPTNSNESNGIQVLRALFTGLVQYDPTNNQMFLANAESITSDDGGKTWTVVLKPGWTFHNGEPVTALSYVNAWNYGANQANAQQNNSFYAGIVGYDELNSAG